jgi:PAS domain S-box-containing protein
MDLPLGVMVLTARSGGWFDEEAKRLLGIVGAQVGSTIHNSMLYSQAKETRDYLEGLIQNTADAIITYGLDGTVRTWNEAASKIYGYSEDEAVGRSMVNVPDDQLQEMNEVMRRVVAGETVSNHRTVLRKKDGTTIPVAVTYSPVRNSEGAVVAVSSISRDVSQAELAEQEASKCKVQESGMKLRGVVNALIPLLTRRSLPDSERVKLVSVLSEKLEQALYQDYIGNDGTKDLKTVGGGIAEMFNDLGGQFDSVVEGNQIIITAIKCPWENELHRNPANCMLTKALITRFAVHALGNARVSVTQTLASNDGRCRVTVHSLDRPLAEG